MKRILFKISEFMLDKKYLGLGVAFMLLICGIVAFKDLDVHRLPPFSRCYGCVPAQRGTVPGLCQANRR